MAIRYAVANGNWSNTATWDGGTLPTSADDVHADGKTVDIDQNITVLTLRTTQRSGGINGGLFRVPNGGVTITCTNGLFVATGFTSLNITATSNVININSNILGQIANTSTVTISGAGSTVNIVGNITGGGGGLMIGLSINANSTVNITGNIIGGNGTSAFGVNISTVATVNITGNLLAQAQYAVSAQAANCVLNVIGVVTSSSTRAAVFGSSTSTLRFSTPIINDNGRLAVESSGQVFLYQSPVSQWTFQNELNTNKILYSPGAALGNPATTDVRNGVTYASGALTGTLVVPNVNAVTKGVVFDNGSIGTAENTAASFLAELSTSTDPLAIRLQNVSTVQTTGAQIAAYNV